jgi:hypothetical protein
MGVLCVFLLRDECLVYTGVHVLTAVAMENTALVVTPYILVQVHRCFGGAYCLHIQGLAVSQARHYEVVGSKQRTLHLLHTFMLIITVILYIANAFNGTSFQLPMNLMVQAFKCQCI